MNVVGPASGGRPHRLVSVRASAIDAALPTPATTPTPSSPASGPITTRPTPSTPINPHPSRHVDRRSRSTGTASTATASGCAAAKVAATPPGRCSADRNSSGNGTPI